jgi:hypothetical protein
MFDPSDLITDAPGVVPVPDVEQPAPPTPDIQVKAGRVLSGRNESALRESLAALTAAMTQMHGVLAQVETGKDEDEAAPAEAGITPEATADLQPTLTITDAAEIDVDKDMAVFRLVDDPEPRFAVDPTMVSEAIARGFVTSLTTVVEARVGAAISALRGRID